MSNRKKWKWIFSGFAIVIFISIAVVLVLFEKYKNEDRNNNNSNNDIQAPSQSTEIYATSFSLNVPDTLQILVNTKVKLSTGYVNVMPASVINKLTYEITRKSGQDINGIIFKNNIINANSVGTYSLKFKMPKSASTNFSKTIDIIVYEEKNSSHICQTNNSIIIGEDKNVDELFSIADEINYQIETDSKITISNGTINAITSGDSKIKFTFIENYVQYIYDFTVTVKEQPIYQIVVVNGTNNTIEIDFDANPFAKIHYEVKNGNEKHIYQDVVAVSNDEGIVKVNSYTEPYVNIEAVGIGETTITIIYSHYTSIKIEVKIIVN